MKGKSNMFNKTFDEMMKIDVTPYVKQRDGADYLGWAMCKKLLHDNGAEVVMFYPVPGPDGSNLRMSNVVFTDKEGKSDTDYRVFQSSAIVKFTLGKNARKLFITDFNIVNPFYFWHKRRQRLERAAYRNPHKCRQLQCVGGAFWVNKKAHIKPRTLARIKASPKSSASCRLPTCNNGGIALLFLCKLSRSGVG